MLPVARSTIENVHRSLLKGDISVSRLCEDALKTVEQNKFLNAFITICNNEARSQAKGVEATLSSRLEHSNPLIGIPISVKDNFSTKGIATTCGSKMLHNYVPPYDATVVKKLVSDAQCILIGKTNMDEFAMGSSCTTSYFGHAASFFTNDATGQKPSVANASDWYMAGGSSTGSAISVATGSCFASIGTDTGGSTRQPASLCGVVGFKPSYGLISRFGLIPLAHCLDVVSILASHVPDVRLIFEQIVGQDKHDLTTVDHRKVLKYNSCLAPGTTRNKKLRIGIPEGFVTRGDLTSEVSQRYSDIIKQLDGKTIDGVEFQIMSIDLDRANMATECYTIISCAEIASNMSCYDGLKYGYCDPSNTVDTDGMKQDEFYKRNRDNAFGAEVKKRILLGNYFLLEDNRDDYLVQAQKVRRLIMEDFDTAFETNTLDLILMPATPTTTITHAEWLEKCTSNRLFHEDYYLIPANLANLPSICLPSGVTSKGLPIGFQLMARKFHDLDLLSAAEFFESNVFI